MCISCSKWRTLEIVHHQLKQCSLWLWHSLFVSCTSKHNYCTAIKQTKYCSILRLATLNIRSWAHTNNKAIGSSASAGCHDVIWSEDDNLERSFFWFRIVVTSDVSSQIKQSLNWWIYLYLVALSVRRISSMYVRKWPDDSVLLLLLPPLCVECVCSAATSLPVLLCAT